MLVVNLLGGPGTGKSTTAAALFSLLKRAGYRAELVTERAKELCYERSPLMANQLYILAAQYRRLYNLNGHGLDVVVTDGPLALSHVYAAPPFNTEWWHTTVSQTVDTFANFNVFLHRVKPYGAYGRTQTEAEARALDTAILANPYIAVDAEITADASAEHAVFQLVQQRLAAAGVPVPEPVQ